MDGLIKPFRDALESLDRVRAEAIFQQAMTDLTPIAAVEQVVVEQVEHVQVRRPQQVQQTRAAEAVAVPIMVPILQVVLVHLVVLES